ncbi:MAG: hypothetical protein L0L69_05350 [Propionibacterium sp.]|nr:hypothetical protein [Propionibacterium sp.]
MAAIVIVRRSARKMNAMLNGRVRAGVDSRPCEIEAVARGFEVLRRSVSPPEVDVVPVLPKEMDAPGDAALEAVLPATGPLTNTYRPPHLTAPPI